MRRPGIETFQALRLICAMLIMAHHFGFPGPMVKALGDYCVSIFLMLSGLVMTYSRMPPAQSPASAPSPSPSFLPFMRSRIKRLWPMYLIGWLACAALAGFHVFNRQWVVSALMLQSWVPEMGYYFCGNAPAWYVSTLLFAYAIFPPALRLLLSRPHAFDLLLCALLAAYITLVALLPAGDVFYTVYIFPPMQALTFLLGMRLARALVTRIDSSKPRRRTPAVPLFISGLYVLLTLLALWCHRFIPERWALCAYFWPVSAAILALLYAADLRLPIALRDFLHRYVAPFGDASYAFYILHFPLILAASCCLSPAFPISPFWLYLGEAALLWPIALLLHRRLNPHIR